MNKTALELYLYMNSSDEIIKWLESEKVTTQAEAKEKLEPIVGGVMRSWASQVGAGNGGRVTLAGASGCVNKVMKHFEKKEEEAKDKK